MNVQFLSDLPDCPECEKAKLIPHIDSKIKKLYLICLHPDCDYVKIKDYLTHTHK